MNKIFEAYKLSVINEAVKTYAILNPNKKFAMSSTKQTIWFSDINRALQFNKQNNQNGTIVLVTKQKDDAGYNGYSITKMIKPIDFIPLTDKIYKASLGINPSLWKRWYTDNGFVVGNNNLLKYYDGSHWRIEDKGLKRAKSINESSTSTHIKSAGISNDIKKPIAHITLRYRYMELPGTLDIYKSELTLLKLKYKLNKKQVDMIKDIAQRFEDGEKISYSDTMDILELYSTLLYKSGKDVDTLSQYSKF